MSPVEVKQTPAAIRLAVVIAGLIVLAAAGYFLLVQPKESKLSSLNKDIAAKTLEIDQRNQEATQAAGLSKILVADYFKLTTAMPDEVGEPEVILQLQAIAKATGVSFDAVTPGAVIGEASYEVIPLALTFQGSFLDLSDFLYRLRSLVLVDNHKLVANGRLFTIDQVSFTQGDGGFPNINASVQLNAYVYGQPVPTTNAATETTSTDTTSTTTTPSSSDSASATGAGS